MTSAEGSGRLPNDLADLDEESAPQVRRFLEAIARSKPPARAGKTPTGSASEPTRVVDRERQVMRFAWTCEELNVALRAMDADDTQTMEMLREHGVDLTLAEIQAQAAALAAAIDRVASSHAE